MVLFMRRATKKKPQGMKTVVGKLLEEMNKMGKDFRISDRSGKVFKDRGKHSWVKKTR
jgi:hypothetical protein